MSVRRVAAVQGRGGVACPGEHQLTTELGVAWGCLPYDFAEYLQFVLKTNVDIRVCTRELFGAIKHVNALNVFICYRGTQSIGGSSV